MHIVHVPAFGGATTWNQCQDGGWTNRRTGNPIHQQIKILVRKARLVPGPFANYSPNQIQETETVRTGSCVSDAVPACSNSRLVLDAITQLIVMQLPLWLAQVIM
jgi:hypothetical protein